MSLVELYGQGQRPLMEHVDQGDVGDCWLLATLAAIVRTRRGQDLIMRNIQEPMDGCYSVRLYGLEGTNSRTGWQTYRISSRPGACMPETAGSSTSEPGTACESCRASDLDELDAPGFNRGRDSLGSRADATPNASSRRILWVVLYETAMRDHMEFTSYSELGDVANGGSRAMGVNPGDVAMKMIMGPQAVNLQTFGAFSSQSEIPDLWRLITNSLERRSTLALGREAALIIGTKESIISRPPHFPDRDIHGNILPPGNTIALSQGHQYTLIGVVVSDPESYCSPDASPDEGNAEHLFIRIRNPWGTNDGTYTEREIRHAVDMINVIRFFDMLSIFSIPDS